MAIEAILSQFYITYLEVMYENVTIHSRATSSDPDGSTSSTRNGTNQVDVRPYLNWHWPLRGVQPHTVTGPPRTVVHETFPAAPNTLIYPSEGALSTVFALQNQFKTVLRLFRPPFASMDPDEAGDTDSETKNVDNETKSLDSETEAALERSRLNRLLPINTLPPEVLQIVFLPVPEPLQPHYKPLFDCRSVCRYWMEVIDLTPELWTRISSMFHPKLQAMIVQNSGNQHLDVEYEDGSVWSRDPEKEEKLAAFALLVKPLAPRWKALEYHRGFTGNNDTMFSLHLPNLTRIQVDGLASGNQRPTLDAPKLSYVRVSHCPLDWTCLSGLQVLSLHSTHISLSRLMIILQASPGLRSLTLEQMSFRVAPNGFPDSDTRKIFLLQLRTLHIERSRGSTQSISSLLDWIEAPSLETVGVEIGYTDDSDNYTQLCESAGQHIGAFLPPEGRNRSHLSIEVWDLGMHLGVGQQRTLTCKSIWGRTIGPQVKLAFISSAMKRMDDRVREELKVLDLDCTKTEDIGQYLRIVHSHFPRIDQVLVRDEKTDRADVDTVLQLLSSPSRLKGSEEWLLPNLTKVQLDLHRSTSANLGDRIVELIKSRKGKDGIEEITELRIVVSKGAIDPSTIEILRQSLVLFHLNEN